MKAIITEKDGSTVTHNIDFANNEIIDIDFEETELAHQNLADVIQDITYMGAIPFIRYCSKTAVDIDQAKLMKELFLKGLDTLLDKAMENDGPIGYPIKAKKENELYGFMEELYYDWLSGIRFTTESLRHDFKDYTFKELIPTFDLWYTLSMVFENEKGDIRHLPMKLLPAFETASDDELKRHATFCHLIAVVVLDKLSYDPNPLREMSDLEAFEEEQLRIVKDYLESVE